MRRRGLIFISTALLCAAHLSAQTSGTLVLTGRVPPPRPVRVLAAGGLAVLDNPTEPVTGPMTTSIAVLGHPDGSCVVTVTSKNGGKLEGQKTGNLIQYALTLGREPAPALPPGSEIVVSAAAGNSPVKRKFYDLRVAYNPVGNAAEAYTDELIFEVRAK